MNETKSSVLAKARIWVPLTALALVVLGHFQMAPLRQQMEQSRMEAKALWENQPKRFPLDGLTVGVYTPLHLSPLAAFDAGQSTWMGSSLWVQVGRMARGQDQVGYDYFSAGRHLALSAALFFQVVIPCLALWLCLDPERSWMAALQGMLEAVAPGLGLAALAAAGLNFSSLGADGAVRLILVLAVYLLYLLAATSITWLCFRMFQDATLATTLAAAFWVFNLVLARPLTTNVAATLHPTPTLEQLARKLEFELRNGYSGVEPRRDRERRFVAETLAEYRVNNIDALPVNLSAVMLKKEERHQRDIYGRRIGELRDTFARQERFEQFASILLPSVAVQVASSALSATDFANERAQLASVDARWAQITEKVYEDVVKSAGTDGSKVARGPEFWRQFPPVEAVPVPVPSALASCLIPAAGLLGWGLTALLRKREEAA